MASFFAKIISKKILGERLENNFGKEDPYFETVPATRLNGKPSTSKTKKRPKALPPGISEHDGRVLTKVKRRAYRLDMSLFSCFGIRFGWSSVIGIIPAIGDVIDAFMALMVLRTCQQVEGGLPASVKSKMMFNIIVDFGIGLVPFLGDIVDALFRANTKNAIELERYLREKGAKNLQAQGRPAAMDPTDPDEYDRLVAEQSTPPRIVSEPPSRQATQTRKTGTGSSSRDDRGGWINNNQHEDIERGDRRREDGPLPPSNAHLRDEPRRNTSKLQKGTR